MSRLSGRLRPVDLRTEAHCEWFIESKRMPDRSSAVLYVSEAVCADVLSRQDAFAAVEKVFAAADRGEAYNFPVIREAIGHADALYGFKSGFDRSRLVLGVKSGGYWPGNSAKGLTNHQSTVFLFDADSGRLRAIVGANYLTAVRTAAASAVSIRHLARADAKVLGIVGAGHQSAFQVRAACEQRKFDRVLAWNAHPEMLPNLGKVVERDVGIAFESVERERLCAEADVIITITSAYEALLMKDWIRPGTHFACMGTDTKGKQEVDPDLFSIAKVFADDIEQSMTIGEAQHAVKSGLITAAHITPLGAVINGTHAGRVSETDITLFDGTGIALQDLATATVALERAAETDQAVKIPF